MGYSNVYSGLNTVPSVYSRFGGCTASVRLRPSPRLIPSSTPTTWSTTLESTMPESAMSLESTTPTPSPPSLECTTPTPSPPSLESTPSAPSPECTTLTPPPTLVRRFRCQNSYLDFITNSIIANSIMRNEGSEINKEQ